MYADDKLLIAKGDEPVYMLPHMANRHGLVAGATGTGKTVTVKTIIQSMSDAGIPTFVADVKGDDGQEAPAYNLSGQRVGSSYRGVVIQNGKKTLRK